jgi:hypothetical protein
MDGKNKIASMKMLWIQVITCHLLYLYNHRYKKPNGKDLHFNLQPFSFFFLFHIHCKSCKWHVLHLAPSCQNNKNTIKTKWRMLGFKSDFNMSLMPYLFVIYETIIYNTETLALLSWLFLEIGNKVFKELS